MSFYRIVIATDPVEGHASQLHELFVSAFNAAHRPDNVEVWFVRDDDPKYQFYFNEAAKTIGEKALSRYGKMAPCAALPPRDDLRRMNFD